VVFNLTQFAVYISRSTNAVAMRHAQVSRVMFPLATVTAVTNGVHAATWVAPPMAAVFDKHFPDWRWDNRFLRYAIGLPVAEVRGAHAAAKHDLLAEVKRRTGRDLDPNALTIGFARRATEYKRAELLFTDLARLRRIARRAGPLQVIFAGKAHPNDAGGKEIIQRIFKAAAQLKGLLPVVYLEDYSMALGKYLCAGVDVWLNTPQKPLEASGTSGMKAALNGVPSLSVRDGWWIEGHIEGATGWAIGDDSEDADAAREATSLYDKLELEILPLFYKRPAAFGEVRRNCIDFNGSFFNTQRMMLQYARDIYTRRQEGAVS
jgi:starch phosphorylase